MYMTHYWLPFLLEQWKGLLYIALAVTVTSSSVIYSGVNKE